MSAQVASSTVKGKTDIWKMLLALVVNGALFVVVPWSLQTFNLVSTLTRNAYIILGVTAFGIGTKIVFGDMISGKFNYYKHGYDFCTITMGASISSLALQLTSDKDLFPGLAVVAFWDAVSARETVIQRQISLCVFFLVGCFFSLLTAHIAKVIKDSDEERESANKVRKPELLSLLNFVLGATLFGVYILILLSKG